MEVRMSYYRYEKEDMREEKDCNMNTYCKVVRGGC